MKYYSLLLNIIVLLFIILSNTTSLTSQPFVDPFQLRYTYGFQNKNAASTPFDHLWIGSDLPIRLKENTYLVFSPTYDQWNIDSAEVTSVFPVVRSFAFPVGFSTPINQSRWSFTLLAIPRWNGEKLFEENTFQIGGALLAAYALKPKQKFRAGVYVNNEFFGLYVVPLVGIDWKINHKNYLFGVLPGRLTFEHQWNKHFYSGITFRAITSSYRLADGQFLRLDDNQLSLFLDYYLSKHICITLEPGYGLLRQLRLGQEKNEYDQEVEWGDGPFIKLSGSYRIRL